MPLTVATWNINSLRLREALVARFLAEARPDVLCLQETKSPVDKLPTERFAALGYGRLIARGEKGYNGVAILSRLRLEPLQPIDFCGRGDARHVAAITEDGLAIHNLYVPAGGDTPDPARNPKFAHKLAFVDELADWSRGVSGPTLVLGDLNIAPGEDDVWSHKHMLKVVSHTPVEVEAFGKAQAAGRWTDVTRALMPQGKLYSWWSYRARDWEASDRGLRLDHIWASPDLAPKARTVRIARAVRGWPQPSDHAPVIATFG
ncbi:MAG: exodeoxyribonuclease III [Rhodobacteraceae bacterium]|nr:MAG: exodeoxyribonuclease III [Paracoccaceae bacterium]